MNRHHHTQATGKGPSSFWMHDSTAVFHALALKPGDAFLDLGCGPGDYSLAAARIVGPSGSVVAVDKWGYLIDDLMARARNQGLNNLEARVGDITAVLPINNRSIDLCLLSTVVHVFGLTVAERTLFPEVRRTLKPGGRLAVIECKKEEQAFGPPLHLRLSPEELETVLKPMAFRKRGCLDLGTTYLVQFGRRH